MRHIAATRRVGCMRTLMFMPSTYRFELIPVEDEAWVVRPAAMPQTPEQGTSASPFEPGCRSIGIKVMAGREDVDCVAVELDKDRASMELPNAQLLEAWLFYLRMTGRLSFEPGSRSEKPQVIPRHCSLTHLFVLVPDHAVGFEHAILRQRGIYEKADLLRLAPATSLAGIAARIGKEADFLRLVALRPFEYCVDLLTPLYRPLTSMAEGAQSFAFAVPASGDGYLWLPGSIANQHCHAQVSKAGQLFIQMLPIDAFGFEPDVPRFVAPECLDSVCHSAPAHSVLDALDQLRELIAQIVSDLLSNRPTGVYAFPAPGDDAASPELDAWIEAIMATLQDDLFAMEQCVRWNVYPFDGVKRPSHLTRWLHADADVTLQHRRQQALTAMPYGVPALVLEAKEDVMAAIDQCCPILDAIRRAYGVPAWVVRRVMTARSTSEGEFFSCIGRKAGFSAAIHRIHALGAEAPELPPELVGHIQWLIDTIGHERRNFTFPARTIERVLTSLGRTAAKSGWMAASRLVSNIKRCRLSLTLLDSIATATVSFYLASVANADRTQHGEIALIESSIVEAWLGDLDARAWLRRAERLATFDWIPIDPSTSHALKMAAREHGTDASIGTVPGTGAASMVKSLFGPCSWMATRVNIRPLTTIEALQEEAVLMENCLARLNRCIERHEQFIVVLESADGDMRANAALELDEEGSWRVAQIRGPANSLLDGDSTLHQTATTLVHWMSTESADLEQTALEAFRRRHDEMHVPIDIDSFKALSVQRLPAPLRDQVLACLPGQGSLEHRIWRAIRRARKGK